jgi:DNA-binding MarR family transcriptional regulator
MAGYDMESPNSGLEGLLLEVRTLEHGLRKASALLCTRHGVPEGSWGVLEALGKGGPQTVPQIGRSRALSRQNIQVLVNRLQRNGSVQSVTNPAHKRSSLICLTEKGRALAQAVAKAQAGFLESLSGRCSEAELAAAAGLLERLRQSVAEAAEQLGMVSGARPAPEPEGGRLGKRTLRRTIPPGTAHVDAEPPTEVTDESPAEDGEFPVSLL